jgi:hypothetical protein
VDRGTLKPVEQAAKNLITRPVDVP